MGNLRLITTATALASLTAFGTAANASDAITFVSWGGATPLPRSKLVSSLTRRNRWNSTSSTTTQVWLKFVPRSKLAMSNGTSLTSRHKTLSAAVTKAC